MKKSLIFVGLALVACTAMSGRPLIDDTCQHWAQCTGEQSQAQAQCVTGEVQAYDEITVGCQDELDATLLCFSTMPCDGWKSSDAEKSYCGTQMKALADCR